MKLVLTDKEKLSQFAVLFQNLKTFSEHVIMYMSEEGIYMQGMDSSQCSCFDIKLRNHWFDSFNFVKEDDISTLGLSTNVLQKIIGTRRDGQNIEMSVSNDGDNLEVIFSGQSNVLDKYFEVPLMDIEQDLLQVSSSESDVDLVMSSKNFCELITQLQIFNDKLSLKFTEDKVTFLSSGSEGSMKVNVSFDNVVEYAIAEDITLEQSYSLKFISMMCSFSKMSEKFSMAFSQNRPMEGQYKLDGDSYVKFYLAPRVDEDIN